MRGITIAIVLVGASVAHADVTVTVDAEANKHDISPLIYGMNFPSGDQLAAGIPVARWGGNSTSRYNYQIDVDNTGNDYYFENIPGCWSQDQNYCASPPSDPKESSTANAFLAAAQAAGAVQLFTLPTLGWVAKAPPVYAHPFVCGCPSSFNNGQDSYDQYDTNCGNCQSGGQWITLPATNTTSTAIEPSWDADWVTYLTGKFGASNGKRIYELDNEPALWSSTHHDIRPQRLTYDELWQRMRDHAVAVLGADPTAQISGPAEWGWPNYFCSDADIISNGCSASSPDRAAHGGEELLAWLLDQANAYEQANGTRILHYLDLHYYPQGGDPPAITRSLWDPTYTDPSWIGDTIRLIPRMHDWVDQHYPGTKLAISEYDFYHHDEAIGAVTYAEVLGIFGREGVDIATAWSPPAPTEAAFGAFLLYLNYDGQGGHFESTGVQATVAGDGVQAFASTGSTQMTLVLVNETGADAPVTVKLANFTTGTSAKLYTGSSPAITAQPDVSIASGQLSVTVPATSFAMVAIPRDHALPVDAPEVDGGVTGDGGGNPDSGSGGGCCDAGRGSSGPIGAIALGFVGLAALRRRRS
ncbi:MAG TPA: glycoside hydrolase family 44 protein [Kofleriaceae bacterium]|jgi:hypothetical protein